jgi:hypothetical protein
MSAATLGLWLPVWAAHELATSRRARRLALFSAVGLFGLLWDWAAVSSGVRDGNYSLMVLAAVLGGVVLLVSSRRAGQPNQREISARADYEHAMLMSGHLEVGIHGRFPPRGL